MTKRRVIDRNALPVRNPLLFFIVLALLLDRQITSDIWWGVFYTVWFLCQLVWAKSWLFDEVEVLPRGYGPETNAEALESDEPRAGSSMPMRSSGASGAPGRAPPRAQSY